FILFVFFFSSRRRHTRFSRDWSQTCALPILYGSPIAEQRLHKGHLIEYLQIVDLFADANVFYRDLEFIRDTDNDAAFGSAVQLGDGQRRDVRSLGELAGLHDGVLTRAPVEYEQHLVGCLGYHLLHDTADLG